MPTLLLFGIFLGAALLLTALLFYPVFQLVTIIGEVRPDRVFYRLAMIIAAAGFWPFLKALGIADRVALGFAVQRRRFLGLCTKGLIIGVMIMSVHLVALLLIGARVPAAGISLGALAHSLLSGLLAGLLVAIIEETFFRGALQYHLRRGSSLRTTAVATSLVYAAMHFIRPPEPATCVDWHSGWEMLAGMFLRYENFAGFADSFAALFTAGLLLSLIRERTGHIGLCIGIHAGWVMMIKLAGQITGVASDSPAAVLIGSYDYVIGWAAAAMLALVTLGYWRYGRDRI